MLLFLVFCSLTVSFLCPSHLFLPLPSLPLFFLCFHLFPSFSAVYQCRCLSMVYSYHPMCFSAIDIAIILFNSVKASEFFFFFFFFFFVFFFSEILLFWPY